MLEVDVEDVGFYDKLLAFYAKESLKNPEFIKKTKTLLIQYMNHYKGKVEKKYWYTLFDLRYFENDKEGFEKTADLYAKTLNQLPPNWIAPKQKNKNSVDFFKLSDLNNISKAKVEDLIKEATENNSYVRVDFSAADLENLNEDKNDLDLLIFMLRELMGTKCQIIGSMKFVRFLQNQIEKQTDYKNYWLLLFALYQLLGNQLQYEELTDLYLTKFEETVMEFKDKFVVEQSNKDPNEYDENVQEMVLKEKVEKHDLIFIEKFLKRKIEELDAQEDLKSDQMVSDLKKVKTIEINFEDVKAIHYGALEDFAKLFLQYQDSLYDKKVVLKNLRQIIYSSMLMIGVDTKFVELKLYKY